METSKLIRTIALLGTGGVLIAAACVATAETVWKAHVWGPKRASSAGFEWYAEQVTAKTGGQMRFNFAYDQGKPTEAPEKLKSGAVEASYFCTQFVAEKTPLTTVIDLPMLAPEDPGTLGRVVLAVGDQPAVAAELRNWNVKMLVAVPTPLFQMMGTRRVAKLEDLRGARIHVSPEMGKVLSEYGATVISGTFSGDSVAALKGGSIDLIALPPFSLAAYKVDDASKYMTDRISLGATACYFGVSQRAWDALPAKLQNVMLELRGPAVAKYGEMMSVDTEKRIAGFRQKGLEVTEFGSTDRARLVAKAIKVWHGWVDEREKQGLKGKEVFEFTQAKIREFNRK